MPRWDLSRGGTIVDEETFALLTELEIRKAARLQYPVSVLAIRPDPEGGGEIPDPSHLAEQVAWVISLEIRGTDLVCPPTASSTLLVLLIDAHLERLPVVIQRITDQVERHLFDIDRERKALTLSLGGGCVPTTASTRQDLLTQADVLLQEAGQGGPGRSRWRLPGSPNIRSSGHTGTV